MQFRLCRFQGYILMVMLVTGSYIFSMQKDFVKSFQDLPVELKRVIFSTYLDSSLGCNFSPVKKIKFSDKISVVSLSPDESNLLVGFYGEGNPPLLVDPETGLVRYTLSGHSKGLTTSSVSWSSDNSFVVTGSFDHTACKWSCKTGEQLVVLNNHSNWVYSTSVSPDNELILTGGKDKKVCVWLAKSGLCIKEIADFGQEVHLVTFNSDGKTFLVGLDDGTLRLYETGTWNLLKNFEDKDHGHKRYVTTANFSPDGKSFVSGSFDRMVCLWDVDTAKRLFTMECGGWIYSVVFSPDGTSICATTGNRMLYFWDTYTGALIRELEEHEGPVSSVAWTSDGTTLFTGSDDHFLCKWSQKKESSNEWITTRKGRAFELFLERYSLLFSPNEQETALNTITYEQ